MSLTSGYALACSASCSGGIDKVALCEFGDIATFTATGNSVSAITKIADAGAGFREFGVDIERVTFNEEVTRNEDGCGYATAGTLVIRVSCPTATLHLFLDQLKAACCEGFVLAFQTASGIRVAGLESSSRVKLMSTAETVGEKYTDLSQVVVTFDIKARNATKYFSGAWSSLPFAA